MIDICDSTTNDVSDETLSEQIKQKVRSHIHFLFERFLLEGTHENDWTVPVKRWLQRYARSKNAVLPIARSPLT
ncbi:hypothetical protein [Treponema medium]|uniref:hypothetical protein n=1 Tax=Treponema medium TaxID=58231 RepID=UPI00039C0C14|nr:hypothetical protein [Treponema medium]